MSTFIIVEAGVNHNGNIEIAKKLVDAAIEANADAIKFQTFKSENLVSKFAQKAQYQKNNTGSNETQLEMIKKLELSFDEFIELSNYCKERGILFLSTAFDFESMDFLYNLGMKIWKIPSGEITNLPYLEKIASFKLPIILSTGMSTMEDVENALNILKNNGVHDITVLHCTTEYPTPFEHVNLKAMETIKNKFNIKVGYSDHTKGIEVPIAAVAMGALVIEKHFTLDKKMKGPDHKASLEPDELKVMIKYIRNIEKVLGNGIKAPSKSEIKNMKIARKSIVAKCDIKKGEVFTEGNISVKRPGNGISPMNWYKVLGKIAIRDFIEDELIDYEKDN